MPPYVKTSPPLRALGEPEYQIKPRSPSAGFLIGLLWHHESYGDQVRLKRYSTTPRNHLFPSWTWASCWQYISSDLAFDQTCTMCDFGAQVSVELPDGTILPFPIDHSTVPAFVSEAQDSTIIHITAKVSSCQIASRPRLVPFGEDVYVASVTGDDEQTFYLEFSPDILIDDQAKLKMKPSLLGKSLTAIIFAVNINSDYTEHQFSVIVVDEDSNENISKRSGYLPKTSKSIP
jgi:hypothetical protein